MDNQDYLTDYRLFFDNFYQSFEKDNPLPVHIGKYNVAEFEIVGEVICWCLEYLNIRKCPFSLIAPLCRSVIVELEDVIRRDPESCGYRSKEDDYQTLKLMQVTIKKLNEVCLRYRDNSEVSRLPPPPPVSPSVSAAAVKNGRRTMEDSHIVIHDLHALFGIEGYGVASYYAVFDGHIGSDAAIYSCSHIYQYLVESRHYPSNPEAAFKEAFIKTDERFIDKSNKEKLKSGTTAVCILIRHDLGKLYVAWLGDSQAILVNGRDYIQLVNPHRPEQFEEKERIEAMGGSVVFWGTWRVNGQLAVSRAIGDVDYKPYVTAEPDVTSHDLTGDEDFLLLACDGLWDVISEKQAVEEVYKCLELHKGDRSSVSQSLVQAAKSLGSKDNISVVVAWLDMSTLENGHFVPGSEVVDSAEDILLPPVLRSLKPPVQTIAPPVPQRLDESAEKWLKTLPWSYADALRKPAPKKEDPPPLPVREPAPLRASDEAPVVESKEEPVQEKEEVPTEATDKKEEEVVVGRESEPSQLSPKDDNGDVGGDADSGDDSDEEWNYISGKENRQPNQHTKQELTQEEMESQLNPNAAEFVPVYGRVSPTSDIDIVDISHSPSKPSELKNLENVVIPTSNDFFNEISRRPSEIDDLCENDATLNGGELNDISTKAVFGDDSITLNSAIDSSQSEPLKDTNPFAPSQVPNFVQDHFSAPNFKAFNESKPDEHKFDFMMGGDKSDFLSTTNEPTLEAYKSGQTDLSGIIFGDGVNVDEIARSKQDSPLLRESPEPGLHNGQVDHHEDKSSDNVTTLAQENDKINEEIIPSQPPKSPLPSESLLETPEIGPETSVDSESEDDVLVSPKIKERSIGGVDQTLVEDPICSLAPPHETNTIEKFETQTIDDSRTESALEMEDVYHKDDEEDLICPLKQNAYEGSSNSAADAQLESMHLPEKASTGATDEISEQFNSEQHFNCEETSHIKINDNEASSEQASHPEEVKEMFFKEEVHEDLICPMKETPLVQESSKNLFEHESNVVEEQKETTSNLESYELIPEPSNIELQLDKSAEKDIDIIQENKDALEHLSIEKDTDAEETLVCPVKKESDNVYSTRDDKVPDHASHEEVSFCSISKKEELVCETRRAEDDPVCSIKYDEDLVSSTQKTVEDSDLVCPIKKNDNNLVDTITKDDVDLDCPIKNVDQVCLFKKDEDNKVGSIEENNDLISSVNKEDGDSVKNETADVICPIREDESEIVCTNQKENEIVSNFEDDDLICPVKKEAEQVCPVPTEENIQSSTNTEADFINTIQQNTSYEEVIDVLKDSSVISDSKEHVSSEVDDLANHDKLTEDLSHEVVIHENLESENFVEPVKEETCHLSFETHQSVNTVYDVCPKPPTSEIVSEVSVEYSERVYEDSLNNVESPVEQKIQQEEIVDEMSSSMIDHGEDKSLPEAQSNQLDLVQDLQFNEAHEKAEADTESDSGFEIINASEASTIEMEMRIQSEKEAGAADEKLHLDKNEAELNVQEKVEVEGTSERLQNDIKAEESEPKPLEPLDTKRPDEEAVSAATVTGVPTTPPATPAPGLHVENKEGLIAAAVAAAGVATAVAAGTAAVKAVETKAEEKKKPPTPKKAEPTKATPSAKPAPSKPVSGKPAAPAKTLAAKPAAAASAKPTSKPASPATKTSTAPAKPSSKPSTPTTKVAAKPASKPSTPTAPKAAAPTSSTAPKSKPSAPAAPKAATATGAASRPTAKPLPASAAPKKPAPAPAAKPSTGAKPAGAPTVGARPTAKPAAPASAVKSAASSTAKTSPTKTPTPTSKAPTAARPSSAKSSAPSKPPSSSAPAKAAPKPAPAKAPAPKPPTTTASSKAPVAAKTTAAKPAAQTKTSTAPINKKPAAPTAIKKPAAPTDKSVKEANNKLASAKTAVKKVEDKKIVSKKEEIGESEIIVPPTQEPHVTTTNGHISLIENGIPSPEIVAE